MSRPRLPSVRATLARFVGLATRRTDESRMREEMAFHLDELAERYMKEGFSPDEARRRARIAFGGVEAHKETSRDVLRGAVVEDVARDLRHALRALRRRPGLTAGVVLTLALGIGVDAAMFGVLDRLLFRAPDGVGHADRVYEIETHAFGEDWSNSTFSYASYTDFRDHPGAFASVGVVNSLGGSGGHFFPLGRGITGSRVAGALASASFFTALGTTPVLGRFFRPEEDDANRPSNVAVIGYGFWRRRFAGARTAIGATLDIGTNRYRVIGVAPRGFGGVELTNVDVWLPITARSGLRFDNSERWTTNRGAQWLRIVARLEPGVSPQVAADRATAALRAGLRRRIAEEPDAAKWIHPDSERVVLAPVIPGRPVVGFSASTTGRDVKLARLLGLMAIIVLLIACANVGNLLLVHTVDRRREIAVRLTLGVTRARLVRQLVVEGLVLAAVGGVGALLLAQLASQTVRVWLLGRNTWSGAAIDGRVLVFAAAATLVTGLVASIGPALRSSRADLGVAIKSGVRDGLPRRSRVREGLLVVQAALAVVLLAGAGLFVRSVRNARTLPTGVDIDHAIVASFDHRSVGMSAEQAGRVYRDAIERLRSVPGVRAAALTVGLPFVLNWTTSVSVPGRTLPQTQQSPAQYAITPGYFDALGIPVIAGRGFSDDDRAGTARVAIINRTMATLYWPRRNPIGECAKIGADTAPCATIVGVVGNTRRQDLVEGLVPQIYRPLDQVPKAEIDATVAFFGYRLVIGTSGDPARLVEPVRRVMQAASPNIPYPSVTPMRELLGPRMRTWELGARVFTAFGLLALALAALGLYSVTAFALTQRAHELGVRAALGARAPDLLRLALSTSLQPLLIGVLAGVTAAVVAGGFVDAMLFGISAQDPTVLGGVCAILLGAGVLASLVPALRASRVDPAAVLKQE